MEDRQTKTASMAVNEQGDKVIKIAFPYDLTMIQKVRTILGRKYHKKYDCWSAPLFRETLEVLMSWEFVLDEKLSSFLQKSTKRLSETNVIKIPGLKGTLYPFQNWGVSFVEDKHGKALIADDMGLGKTVEALAWLQLHRDRVPVIIVVPAVAKLSWERHAHIWLPNPNTEILSGKRPWKPTGEILIINYDILNSWTCVLNKIDAKVLILDEVHYTKNNGAKRTKAVKRLAKRIPYKLALSGTPIENRPVEIYNSWFIIDPVHCPPYLEFVSRYCNRKYTGFGWDVSGHSHTDELHRILTGTIMLRRKKIDVLPELPPKVGAFVPMCLHNKKEYKAAEADFIAYVREEKGDVAADKAAKAEGLVKIGGLKQLAVKGKLPEVIEWIKDFLQVEDKLVVFAIHTFVIDALMEAFPKIAVKLDGRTSSTKKQEVVDMFQNDPKIKLFVGQMKAAGVVITLTAASNVAIIEYPWTPTALTQAIDRVHRIGQVDSVTAYYLMAQDTIEEKIARLLDEKQKVVSSIIDGETPDKMTSLFEDLMREYAEQNDTKIKRTKFD